MKIKNQKLFALIIVVLALSVIILYLDSLKPQQRDTKFLGDFIWSYNASEPIITEPVIYQDYLFLETDNSIIALNANSGKLYWKNQLSPEEPSSKNPLNIASMKASSNILAIQVQNNLVVYNIVTGQQLWATHFQGLPANFGDTSIFDTTINDDFILVARSNTVIDAYNIKDGSIAWSSGVPDRTSLFIFPDKNKIYLGTINSLLVYDKGDGRLITSYKLNGSASTMYEEENIIYIAFMNGECSFAALDTATLKYQWCTPSNVRQIFTSVNSVATDKNSVYFAGDRLFAISKQTGEILWESVIHETFQKPIRYGDALYVQGDRRLYKLDIHTGREIGEIKSSESFPLIPWSSSYQNINPAISNKMIYLVNVSQVYVYSLSN